MKEKYYIAFQNAEEQSSGIVYLTQNEYTAVQNFLKQVYDFSSGYCGTCGIEEKGFLSKEEAENALYQSE